MKPAKLTRPHSIEPLESRIAPALLVNGANLLGGGSPSSGETSVGENSVQLVKIYSGQAIVWFDGFSITSISVGPGVKMDLYGDIAGDIVANLTAAGALSDSDGNPANGEDGGVLLANDILGINIRPLDTERGSVGNIITGGSVSNVNVSGVINGVYAGDSVFRVESSLVFGGDVTSSVAPGGLIDINPVAAGVQDEFVFNNLGAIVKSGASINGLTIGQGDNLQVFAGNGSPSGAPAVGTAVAGGSISNVNITIATVLTGSPVGTPSYHLLAGDGGNGKVGGAGGSISSIIEINSSGPVVLKAGVGGVGNGGAGGGGGNVINLDLGSSSSQYNVRSGDGGNGTPAGAGGRIANGNFSNSTPIAGVLITADFDGDGIDDVLVADAGTGLMEVNRNLGGTDGYEPIIQNLGLSTITPVGASPVDGLASDVNNDGNLDAVILYRDGTFAAFINQGGGVFYDMGAVVVVGLNLGIAPSKITETSEGSDFYMISENVDGKGNLHGIQFYIQGSDVVISPFVDPVEYNRPIADVAGTFVGLSDGVIERMQVVFDEDGFGFESVQEITPEVSGGLDDLDLSADGSRLLALSSVGKAITVYNTSGAGATPLSVIALGGISGKAFQAKFINDFDPTTNDDIVVLSNTVDTAQLTLIDGPVIENPALPYTIVSDFTSDTIFKNIAPAYGLPGSQPTIVALAGPLKDFTEVSNFASEEQYALPFASKQVSLITGKGGNGLDVGTKLGKGGAGGSMINLNIVAQTISLGTGVGGDSVNGPAGAGGSISNAASGTAAAPGSFKTASGAIVPARLSAEASIEIIVGNGGSPQGVGGKTASGGAGGSMSGFDITLTAGDVQLTAGNGGEGKGAAGGAGGTISRVGVKTFQGGLTLFAGDGGNAVGALGNGGAGGAISAVKFNLTLNEEGEAVEDPYEVYFEAGTGGTSVGGLGGAGGAVLSVNIAVDPAKSTFDDPSANPPLVDTHRDSTVYMSVYSGDGGNGFKGGGAGGAIQSLIVDVLHDQNASVGGVTNFAVLGVFAGDGGDATSGNGGIGGAITFGRPISGVSGFDPDMIGFDPSVPALLVVGGDGGNGSLAGGAGGAVSNLTAQNSAFRGTASLATTMLFSAAVIGGEGGSGTNGNGGVGGAVNNALIGVNRGFLDVFGGLGGNSTNAKGGAGGSVNGSELGLVVSIFALGMHVEGGDGGIGKTGGGVGGNLSGLRINTPQSTGNLSAFLLAGDGGGATGSGAVGGKGGDILNISQAKDYNSSINLVQAGNGGDNLQGKGGAGGNILNFRTVGFIGRPSDNNGNQLGVFDGMSPQGIFSGRGGDGLTDGVNGSITSVVARQIAAMAAAIRMDGTFAAASKISNVTAALIGFDADGDNAFDSTGAPGTSPSTAQPIDGFILAAAISKVTGTRPAFTFLS